MPTRAKKTQPKKAAKKRVPKSPSQSIAQKKRHSARARRRGGSKTTATKKDLAHRSFEGAVARLKRYQLRAYELRSQNYRLAEISDVLAQEFEMMRPPPIATVSRWLSVTDLAYSADLAKLANEMRVEQFNDLEELRKKWWAIATADSLEITRWVRTADGLQPKIDENAYDEQIKAAKLCVDIMRRQASLLGLDIDKHIEQSGEGPKSMQDLQLWIHAQITYGTDAAGSTSRAGVLDAVEIEPLSMEAGIPELEEAI